jgi:hypothetical protein
VILHIFRKDVRRLWWVAGLCLMLLAILSREDRWRSDAVIGSTESWFSLLLPFAWACLIGLLILEEPLVGDRQFWVTRPYSWRALIAAKALFIAVAVHATAFVADCWILSARGLSPAEYLPQLLWKQVLLAAALTLPAAAIAALVRSFAHFVLACVAVIAAVGILVGLDTFPPRWEPVESVRQALAIVAAAAVAGTVVFLQYSARRTTASRGLAIAGAIIAGALLGYLSPACAFGIRSRLFPVQARPALQVQPRREDVPLNLRIQSSPNRVTVAIPVLVTGIPEAARERIETISTEVTSTSGSRFTAPARNAYRPSDKVVLEAAIWPPYYSQQESRWLFLRFHPAAFAQLAGRGVRVAGKAAVTFYRQGQTVWMPATGVQKVPGAGRCTGLLVDDQWSEGMLKVLCESPAEVPLYTWVRLWDPETGQDWQGHLGDSSTYFPGPRQDWLSPLNRRQKFFRLATDPSGPGSQWLVPRDVVPRARIAITPEETTGYSIMTYDLEDVRLSDYVVPPYRR